MAELTAKKRKKLPKKSFVYPGERRYPIHDRAHGAAALHFVSMHGSPAEKKKVRSAVCARYPDFPTCKSRKKYENPLGD